MGCLPDNAFFKNLEMGLGAVGPVSGGGDICSMQNTQCNANAMDAVDHKDSYLETYCSCWLAVTD